eukprot:TRINITY_DN1763_c0_g1_i1.p1 TRINITY_DN1763_c0_g1~~TRINITY_DN1763_c0_g1_i1.p1  ORF type:complete len:703 (-),score=276.26 TRINITY_DN1763_c0_g1_i1:121-2229(-)
MQAETVVVEKVLTGHARFVSALLFHPVRPILLTAGEEGIFMWDYMSGNVIRKTDLGAAETHEARVECLEWVFDGAILASGSKDNNIIIWNFTNENLEFIEVIHGHKAAVTALQFCSLNNHIASAGRDSSIKIWDATGLLASLQKGRVKQGPNQVVLHASLDGHRGDVMALSWSPDGRRLYSGSRDSRIKVWDTLRNVEIRSITGIQGHKADVSRLWLLNNERLMLSASIDGTVKVWELSAEHFDVQAAAAAAARRAQELAEKQADAAAAAIQENKDRDDYDFDSNDAQAATIEELFELDENGQREVESSRVPPESCSELRFTFKLHSAIARMELNPVRPIMATASLEDRSVKIFHLTDLAHLDRCMFHEFVGPNMAMTCAQFVDENRFISSSLDFTFNLYSLSSFKREARFSFGMSVIDLAVTPNKHYVFACGSEYIIKAFSLNNLSPNDDIKECAELEGHCGRVETLAMSPDGKWLASGGHDFSMCLWSVDQLEGARENLKLVPFEKMEPHEGRVVKLAFRYAPLRGTDNTLLLASSSTDHSIKLWKIKNGSISEYAVQREAHDSVVSCLVWGVKGTADLLISGSWDKTIKIWRLDEEHKALVLVHTISQPARINGLAVDPEGRYLASSAAHLMLWELHDNYPCRAIYRTKSDHGSVTCLSIGPSSMLSGVEKGAVLVWPLPDAHPAHFRPSGNDPIAINL